MLDKKERSPATWKQLAINEAAMAVVAINFPDLKNIEFVWPLLLFCYFLSYIPFYVHNCFKLDHLYLCH